MTSILAVDANNDIYIARNGRLAIKTGLSAVIQACEHAVKAQLGEMLRAVDKGVPNFDLIWNGRPNTAQYDSELRRAILGVADVVRVVRLDIQNRNGVLSYTATIQTIYGEGVFSG